MVFLKHVQGGKSEPSAVKRVLKINKESEEEEKRTASEEEENSNARQLLNVEVDFLEIVTVPDDMHPCMRRQALLQAWNQALPTRMIANLFALLRLLWGVLNVSMACCLLQHAGQLLPTSSSKSSEPKTMK
jgi:hypothetical protein